MKYKTILIRFMQEKNHLVKKHSGLVLTTKADMDELRSWSEYECRETMTKLRPRADNGMCPWCINRWQVSCIRCRYGIRNHRCSLGYSRYSKILRRTGFNSLVKFPGIEELGVKYVNKIKRKEKYANEI